MIVLALPFILHQAGVFHCQVPSLAGGLANTIYDLIFPAASLLTIRNATTSAEPTLQRGLAVKSSASTSSLLASTSLLSGQPPQASSVPLLSDSSLWLLLLI